MSGCSEGTGETEEEDTRSLLDYCRASDRSHIVNKLKEKNISKRVDIVQLM